MSKIKAQRDTFTGLQRIIKINKYQDFFEDLGKKELQLKAKEQEELNRKLKSKNKDLQKHNSQLVEENLQLINKIKAIETSD